MPLDLTDKSTLVQVMAWCCQATSHYLSQCWSRFMSPYGITRPQWVNSISLRYVALIFRWVRFSSTFQWLTSWAFPMKSPSCDFHKIPMVITDKWRLVKVMAVAIRQQASIWTNAAQWHHMASLGQKGSLHRRFCGSELCSMGIKHLNWANDYQDL